MEALVLIRELGMNIKKRAVKNFKAKPNWQMRLEGKNQQMLFRLKNLKRIKRKETERGKKQTSSGNIS